MCYSPTLQQAKRSELGAELSSLRARCEQLSSVVASTPKPAASKRVMQRLQQSTQQLQLLQSLQVRQEGVDVLAS
jgi:hypothetical protein